MRILLVVLFGILLSSCVTKKKLTYLRSDAKDTVVSQLHTYKLRKGDNLFVEIKSPEPTSSDFYNLHNNNGIGSYNNAFVYLNSHAVNPAGEITLPFLGSLKVEGSSLQETIQIIEKALTDHLRDATVFVKLVSFEITILGEVNNPGTHIAYDNEVDIFQALGMAGDLTNYGKRKTIKVIRTGEDGSPVTHILDLTSYDIFTSEGFHIYPHDIIYVEPLRIRPVEMNLKPIGIVLSVGALVLLIMRTL